MREPAPAQAVASLVANVRVTDVGTRTVLRLKSWLPERTNGGERLVVDGRELPPLVGKTFSGATRALCVGPGEWLIISHEHSAASLRESIEPDASRYGLAVVNLSDALAGFAVRGSAAGEVLSKGCGLDLHPRSFPAGQCARTRFAQIPVVIECLDEPSRFELHVARSFRHYLRSWLTDAAAEFAVNSE